MFEQIYIFIMFEQIYIFIMFEQIYIFIMFEQIYYYYYFSKACFAAREIFQISQGYINIYLLLLFQQSLLCSP